MNERQFFVKEVETEQHGRASDPRQHWTTGRFLVWNGWDDCPVHRHEDRESAERCAALFQQTREYAEQLKRDRQ